MMVESFRVGVGAVVIDRSGRVLAFERTGHPGAWQLPQGGLEEGEAPRDAVLRELCEETGLQADDVEIVAEHPVWLGYELPEPWRRQRTGRGQVHRWFLLRLRERATPDLERAADREFSAWRWTTLVELSEQTVEFRQPVYRALVGAFAAELA